MPYGVSVGSYLRAAGAFMLSMYTGAQAVHMIYKPLKDFDEIVQKELEKLREEDKAKGGILTEDMSAVK